MALEKAALQESRDAKLSQLQSELTESQARSRAMFAELEGVKAITQDGKIKSGEPPPLPPDVDRKCKGKGKGKRAAPPARPAKPVVTKPQKAVTQSGRMQNELSAATARITAVTAHMSHMQEQLEVLTTEKKEAAVELRELKMQLMQSRSLGLVRKTNMLSRAVQLIVNRALGSALLAWIEMWRTQRHQRLVLGRAIRRLILGAVSASFSSWVEMVSDVKHHRSVLTRVITRMRLGQLSAAFGQWTDMVQGQVRQRNVLGRAVQMIQNRALGSALLAWIEMWRTQRHQRLVLDRAIRRLTLGAVSASFSSWVEMVSVARQRQVSEQNFADFEALRSQLSERSAEDVGALEVDSALLRSQLTLLQEQHAAKMADVNEVLSAIDDEMNAVLRGVDSSIASTLAAIDTNRERLEGLRATTLRGIAGADLYLDEKVAELEVQHAKEMAAARASPVGHAGGQSGVARLEPLDQLQRRHIAELDELQAAHEALSDGSPRGRAVGDSAPPMGMASTVQAQLALVAERLAGVEEAQGIELGRLELAYTEMLQTKLAATLERQSLEVLHAEETAAAVVRGDQMKAALAAVALKLIEQTMEVDEERSEVQAIMAGLGSDVFGSFETGGVPAGTGGGGDDGGDALRSLYDELEDARAGIDGLSAEMDTLPYSSAGGSGLVGPPQTRSRSVFELTDHL